MNLYLLHTEDDPEGNLALVEKEEDIQYLLKAVGDDGLVVKHNTINQKSLDDTYYYVVDNDEFAFVDDCFTSLDDASFMVH